MLIFTPESVLNRLDGVSKIKLDKCVWFIDNLINQKYKIGHNMTHYTPLSSEILKKAIKRYTDIRDILLETGIIGTSASYCPGSSIGFTLNIQDTSLVEYEIQSKTLLKKFAGQTYDPIQMGCKITFSKVLVDENVYKFIRRYDQLSDVQYIVQTNRFRYIEKGQNKIWYDKDGRFYHTITYIMKELRPFLISKKTDERFSAEVDVSSAVPFVLSHLMTKKFKSPPSDMIKFIELSQNGGIYQQMAEDIRSKRDLSDFKEDMLTYLNRENFINRKKVEYQKLRCAYPSVFEFIEQLKSGSHKDLYRKYVKIETDIMIKSAYRNLLDNEIECFPIHDGILTIPSNTQIVREAIENSFRAKLGVVPAIKIKTQPVVSN